MKHQQPNQTNLNQPKPNQTRFSLNAKFSAISYPIELKFGMYAKWYLSETSKKQQNQTKPIQTK